MHQEELEEDSPENRNTYSIKNSTNNRYTQNHLHTRYARGMCSTRCIPTPTSVSRRPNISAFVHCLVLGQIKHEWISYQRDWKRNRRFAVSVYAIMSGTAKHTQNDSAGTHSVKRNALFTILANTHNIHGVIKNNSNRLVVLLGNLCRANGFRDDCVRFVRWFGSLRQEQHHECG